MRSRSFWAARRWPVAALVSVLTLLTGVPAAAQGDPETELVVDGSQATVTVVARTAITPGAAPGGAPTSWPYICRWDEVFSQSDIILAPTTNLVRGHRYWLRCIPEADGGREPIGQFVLYDPADPVPGEDAVTALEIRDFVRDQGLVEPEPVAVGISPGEIQITGVETWLWPDGSLNSIRASANAGGLTVTVEARFRQTTFDMGEAESEPIVCAAQVPWNAGLADPGCSYTYLTESPQRTVTGTTEWDLVWWDDAAQPVPVYWESLSLDEAFDVAVIDLEAVISAAR